jgi:hypothetical protein
VCNKTRNSASVFNFRSTETVGRDIQERGAPTFDVEDNQE